MEAEPQRWAATYTKHVKQKRKSYQDGALLLHPGSGRLILLDDAGVTLESRYLRSSEEVSAGAALSFHSYLVDVGEPEAYSVGFPSLSSAPTASSRTTAGRGAAARARPPSAAGRVNPRVPSAYANPPKSCGDGGGEGDAVGSGRGEVADSRFQEWTALYTTQLTQKAKKYHDGVVRIVQAGPHVKQVILLDEDEQVLGSRHLKSGESIESGKKCHFPNYLIEICEARTEKKGAEHTSGEPMLRTRPKSGENTNNKMGLGAMSKSQKFISPQNFHELEESKSQATASSSKPETRKVEVVSAGSSGGLMETDSSFKEWNALYTTQLTQKAKKYHDGVIRLMQVGSHARQIVLLDEEGGVLCSRYLKSAESVESGTKCEMPDYLIDVCELRCQSDEVKHSLEEASQTGKKNEENKRDKSGAKSKSPKFVSPFKFQGVRKSNYASTTSSNRPQIGKTTCSNMDGPPNFHALSDIRRGESDYDVNRRADHGKSTFGIMDDPVRFNGIQRGASTYSICAEVEKSCSSTVGDPLQFHGLQDGKLECPTRVIRREVGKSTFGNMDDSLRTASQILSIMKPPSEARFSQSNGSGSSGLSHFATQLRTSVQSCLNLETLPRNNSVGAHYWNESSGGSHPTYNHQTIMRPADSEAQDLAMVQCPPSDMSNAKEQKEDSSHHHTGSSRDTVSVMMTTNPGFQEDKSGTVQQLSTSSGIMDGNCDGALSSISAYTLTCKDPKIQELIDDCPSFDLGF